MSLGVQGLVTKWKIPQIDLKIISGRFYAWMLRKIVAVAFDVVVALDAAVAWNIDVDVEFEINVALWTLFLWLAYEVLSSKFLSFL